MSEILDRLERHRVVPVVVIDDITDAPVVADALVAGGLPVAEITLRTDSSLQALAAFASRGDILVGAGTVLTPEHVDRVVDLGARFVVSPGLDQAVVERSREHGVAVLPGVATASELQAALRLGLTAVKVFPAKLLGGASHIDALSAPFPSMRFMPSGGVTLTEAPEYLRRPSVFGVGGSWMVDRTLVRQRDLTALQDLVASTVRTVAGAVAT